MPCGPDRGCELPLITRVTFRAGLLCAMGLLVVAYGVGLAPHDKG